MGLGLEILKSGQGGLIYLYLLSRWFDLSLSLSRWFNLSSSFIKVVLAFIDSLHLLASAATFSLPQVSKKKNLLRFESFSPLMNTTYWSWMQKMLDSLTDISPIQLSSSFAEHYWPHIVPISLPLAQVFLTRQWSKISTPIFCTNINWFVIFQTTVTASAHLTVSITLERYFAVVHPLSHFHRR